MRGLRSNWRPSGGGRWLSVDKANVLDSSRLWRDVVTRVGTDYPDVQLATSMLTPPLCCWCCVR